MTERYECYNKPIQFYFITFKKKKKQAQLLLQYLQKDWKIFSGAFII